MVVVAETDRTLVLFKSDFLNLNSIFSSNFNFYLSKMSVCQMGRLGRIYSGCQERCGAW